MTNFTIEALIDHPELVETIPLSQISVILSAITNHAAAVQSRVAAVQSRLAARILSEGSSMTATDDDRMLTAEEAAKCLNYRLPYVYQLVRENRLAAKREGRKIRIRWGDLKIYMRDGTHKPVDDRLYSTDDGEGAYSTKILGAYPSRVRGPRRRGVELDRSSGAWGKRNAVTTGSPVLVDSNTDDN